MTRADIDGQIIHMFSLMSPDHPIDIIHPNDDEIRVIADDQLLVAELASDDDGFFYFVPVTDGPVPSNTCIRIPYPA